jgi:hypothetical protein
MGQSRALLLPSSSTIPKEAADGGNESSQCQRKAFDGYSETLPDSLI